MERERTLEMMLASSIPTIKIQIVLIGIWSSAFACQIFADNGIKDIIIIINVQTCLW